MAKPEMHVQIVESNEAKRLYSEWRRATAAWDLARFAPGVDGDDLPEEMDAGFCSAEHAALLAFLLNPAETLPDLARKLRVFRDQASYALDEAREIVAVLAEDARRLVCEANARTLRSVATAA